MSRVTQRIPFHLLLHQGVREGATLFPGLLHFTLDPYLIILSVKQGHIKYHFWVFGMTWSGIEPQSPGPLANTLPRRPMGWYKPINKWMYVGFYVCLHTNSHTYKFSFYQLKNMSALSEGFSVVYSKWY